MKNPYKLIMILFIAAVTGLSGITAYAQGTTGSADTTKVKQKEEGSQETVQNQEQTKTRTQTQAQNQQGDAAVQQAGNQNNSRAKVIKQVKGARPDMSKAKGARPNITRPSGSGVPKGAGKPGGVGRMGGR